MKIVCYYNAKREIKIMYCNKCGKEIDNSEQFCHFCGAKQPEKTKVKITTLSKNLEIEPNSSVKNVNNTSSQSTGIKTNTQKSTTDSTNKTYFQSSGNSTAATQQPEKKSSGCLIAFIVFVVILASLIFAGVKYVEYKKTQNPYTSESNSDGNTRLLSRSANNGDITVDSSFDLSSLGNKIYIIPNVDISSLTVSITVYDKNKNVLTQKQQTLGNVTQGNQVSMTVSITDLGLIDTLNASYFTISVVGGTVSYFA